MDNFLFGFDLIIQPTYLILIYGMDQIQTD